MKGIQPCYHPFWICKKIFEKITMLKVLINGNHKKEKNDKKEQLYLYIFR